MKKTFLFLISAILLVAFAGAASIGITPSVAYTEDNLVCAVDTNAGAYIYKWFLSDEYAKTGQTLESAYTETGDTWVCRVYLPPTPWTNEIYLGESSRVISESGTTPGNHAPSTPTITLTSGPYYANSVITASASSTDLDNDLITYEYRFERAGSVLSNSNMLDCLGVCTKGDAITVYARAYDSKDYSAWASTSATISNLAPISLTISYTPMPVYSNSTVTITASATDIDGDSLTYFYAFYNVNTSTMLQDFSANPSYALTSASENNTLRMYATVTDGTANTANSVETVVLPAGTSGGTTNTTNYTYCTANSVNSPVRISDIKNLDSIQDKEFYPLENFKIKVGVENTADDSNTVYVKAIIVKNNSAIKDTETSEKVKVNAESTKTVELNMTVPIDLNEGDYNIYVKVYDENNKTNCDQYVIPFSVKQDEHDIILQEVEFSPSSTISCGTILTFSGKLANIGNSDEEKVKITYEDDLKNKFTDEIDSLDSGDLSRAFNFYINAPKNTTEGKKKITLTLSYEYDEDDKSFGEKVNVYYYYTVSGDCKITPITPMLNLSNLNITSQNQTTEESGFSQFINSNWKSMLIIAEIIIVALVVLKILMMNKFI